MAERQYSDLVIYKRLLKQAKPYWGHIVAIFFVSLLAAPLALLPPLPLKIAVDSVIGSEPLPGFVAYFVPDTIEQSPMSLLWVIVGLLVLFEAVSYLQHLVLWLLKAWAGERLTLDFRSRLFRKAESLSLKYHDSRGTADSIYRIQSDAQCISAVAMEGVGPFITSIVSLLAMLYVTARIDWQISLVALAIVPVLLILTNRSSKRLRNQWGEIKKYESGSLALIQEVLGALRLVKAFGREDAEQKRYEAQSERVVTAHLRAAWIESGFELLVGLTIALGTAAAFYLGVSHVRSGAITLGDLILVMAYLLHLYEPLETFMEKVTDLQSAMSSGERAFCLLDEDPDVPNSQNAIRIERSLGQISFKNVAFRYGSNRTALNEVNLEISAGSRVGVMGHTGAGKSTLASLLIRFHDPNEGTIRLDGVDLREINLADLRNQFAVVLQESILFSTTIRENIAYSQPDATLETIELAAKAANADRFISLLPAGYETEVGERGLQLSGGERQRISLARAFLKDAPILILDEPTSSVDMETESEIIDAMERLMKGRTTLMIAHRLATLKNCDVVLRMDNGRVVEVLDQEELLRTSAEIFESDPDQAGDER